jgi:hypothetical protein
MYTTGSATPSSTRLEGVHAFLDDDLGDLQAFLDHRHLVALLAVEALHFGGVASPS